MRKSLAVLHNKMKNVISNEQRKCNYFIIIYTIYDSALKMKPKTVVNYKSK